MATTQRFTSSQLALSPADLQASEISQELWPSGQMISGGIKPGSRHGGYKRALTLGGVGVKHMEIEAMFFF